MLSISKRSKVNLALFLVLAISVVVLIAGLVGHYLAFELGRYFVLTGLVLLLVGACISLGIYYIRTQKASAQAVLIRDYFWQLRHRSSFKVKHNIQQLPWFYLYNMEPNISDAMKAIRLELFPAKKPETNTYLQFWVCEHCLVITVGSQCRDIAMRSSVMELAMGHVRKMRRQQPLNGLLLTTSPHHLLHHAPYEQEMVTHLEEICVQSRQKLPLMLYVSGMDTMVGFSSLSSCFHRDELSHPWGDWRQDSQIDPVLWFEKVWKQQSFRVMSTCANSIGTSYEAEKNSTSMAFGFEFALLGHQIKALLKHVQQFNEQGWIFTGGYFLVGSLADGTSEDFLAAFCAKGFDMSSASSPYFSSQPELGFNSMITSQVLAPLSKAAGINWRANLFHKLGYRGGVVSCALLVFLASYSGYRSIREVNRFNQETIEAINSYITQEIALSAQDKNSLPVVLEQLEILSIHSLRGHSIPRWLPVSHWATRPTRKKFANFYHAHLRSRLMPFMEMALRQSLADKLKEQDLQGTFENLHLYQMLFDPQGLRQDEISPVLLSGLASTFQLSQNAIERLKRQQAVLFSLPNYSSVMPHSHSLAAAKNKLQGLSGERLVYHRLKAEPSLARYVPVTEFSGGDFGEVFAYRRHAKNGTGNGGSGIPVFFTADGWRRDLFSMESDVLKSSLEDIDRLKGVSPDTSRVRIMKTVGELRRSYEMEYISYWMDYLDSIHIRSLPTLEQQMNAVVYLSRWNTSPMARVLEAVTANTQLQGKKNNNDQDKEIGDSSAEPDMIITRSFAPYHRVTTGGEAPEFARDLQDTLERLYQKLNEQLQAENPGKEAFAQFKEVGVGTHPLNTLDMFASKQPGAIQRWLRGLEDEILQLQVTTARNHIQALWLQVIVEPFRQRFWGRYPFTGGTQAANEVASRFDFEDFFQPGGVVDRFVNEHLSPFLSEGVEKPLLKKTGLLFNFRALRQLEQVASIRDSFFQPDGSLKTHYSLRVRGLSPDVTHFQIQDNQNRIFYDHGPGLWQEVDLTFADGNIISYHFYHGENIVARNTCEGEWGWLQMFQGARRDRQYGRPTLCGELVHGKHKAILELRNQPPSINSGLPESTLLQSLDFDFALLNAGSSQPGGHSQKKPRV